MQVLRVYLQSGGAQNGFPWALLDEDGRLLASGPEETSCPHADETEWILPAGRTRWTAIDWPGRGRPGRAALGFALEEGLINDPAENDYVCAERLASGGWIVAVTAAAPLREALSWSGAHHPRPKRIVPEELLLPAPAPGMWTLGRIEAGWMLRQGRAAALFLPGAAGVLATDLGNERAPDGLILCGAFDVPEAWRHLSCERETAVDWRSARLQGPVNFAQGELTAGRWWRDWRPTLRRMALVMLGVLCVEWAACAVEAGWLSWHQYRLSHQIVERAATLGVRAAAPDEALDKGRMALERLRQSRGLPLRFGALALMSGLEKASGGTLRLSSLNYQNGQLSFSVEDVTPEELAAWRLQLARHRLVLKGDLPGPITLGSL